MEQKTTLQRGIKGVWRHLKSFKKEIVLISIFGVISSVANGFLPYISGKFFDSLITLSARSTWVDMPLWLLFLGIWGVIELLGNNIDWIRERLQRNADSAIQYKVQASGFTHLLELPVSFHKNEHVQDYIQRVSTAGWRISMLISTIGELAPQILSVLIGLVLCISINVSLALILIGGVVLYSLLLLRIVPPTVQADEQAQTLWNEAWDSAVSAVNQVDSVKQASAETYEAKNIRTSFLEKALPPWIRLQRIWSSVGYFQKMIVFMTQFLVFAFSVKLIGEGVITVGQLITINGYSVMFFGPFVSIGRQWQVFQNSITAASKVEELFEQRPEIYVPENAVKTAIKGEVRFDNVTFKYENESNVLHDISVIVHPGQKIALVGESGAGKSTFISLISGYFFPQKGKVLIDGVETSRYDLLHLRGQIAIVPQEIALFNTTLEDNIRYGSFKATRKQVIQAAKDAHLDEFIKSLKQGYKTLVGERGVKLSVGQKQRLAIARAMLRDPKILILDEPTSALDAMTEKNVTESLQELMKDRTTFVIAHRLSTVREADLILVFDKGRIVEQGTHLDLLQKEDGYYKRLHDYQIGIH